MTVDAVTKVGTLPVIEIFGPTIQGEGALAGLPTHFVRFGGCDYRCTWCDSMHAVDPVQVRENAEKLYPADIVERVVQLGRGPTWVTLSGGNPAMLRLDLLVALLQNADYRVTVETQGSRWRDWLAEVDALTVSPKPPSSGMAGKTASHLPRFMEVMYDRRTIDFGWDALKVVVFDQTDLDWAKEVIDEYGASLDRPDRLTAYLSCGTDTPMPGETYNETLRRLADRWRWLCEAVSKDPELRRVKILPQLHVIAWGHQKGV